MFSFGAPHIQMISIKEALGNTVPSNAVLKGTVLQCGESTKYTRRPEQVGFLSHNIAIKITRFLSVEKALVNSHLFHPQNLGIFMISI